MAIFREEVSEIRVTPAAISAKDTCAYHSAPLWTPTGTQATIGGNRKAKKAGSE
jgi:hypothetical protein